MADEAQSESQERNLKYRTILNRAYSFVLGKQYTQTASALTYEELADLQIEQIEGEGTSLRPNELTRVEAIKTEMEDIIDTLKGLPIPVFFVEHETDPKANTPK
jgi:hypothetical protein